MVRDFHQLNLDDGVTDQGWDWTGALEPDTELPWARPCHLCVWRLCPLSRDHLAAFQQKDVRLRWEDGERSAGR